MNFFKKFLASLRLYEAIRMANDAHSKDGERYYVMPTSGKSGQLVIMNRTNFRKLKQKHYIKLNSSVYDLETKCFYCTPYKNGTGKLSHDIIKMKRKFYYSWLNSINKKKA